MYIIDFDDTLFDTQRFKEARKVAVMKLGVSEKQYNETYLQARNNESGLFTYSNDQHAEMLARIGFIKSHVLEVLEETTTAEALPTFLNDNAIAFVEQLKEKGHTMILLSIGDPDFQELKTRESGVHEFFDRTFMVDRTKHEVLRELFEHTHPREAWFINDKIQETKELAEAFPEMKVALRKSPMFDELDYEQSHFDYFHTLDEIYEHITK